MEAFKNIYLRTFRKKEVNTISLDNEMTDDENSINYVDAISYYLDKANNENEVEYAFIRDYLKQEYSKYKYVYRYYIEGIKQIELAKEEGVTRGYINHRVHHELDMLKKDKEFKKIIDYKNRKRR